MKNINTKTQLLIYFYFVLGFNLIAQTTEVTFLVNMNQQTNLGKFDPQNEFVDLAGTFNDWGNNPILLDDSDNDGIYSTSVTLSIGTTIEFKSRINGEWNGREEFPGGGANRSYTVTENGTVEFWYNDELPEGELFVQISASSTFGLKGELIQFYDQSQGNPVSWEWSFEGGTPASSTDQNPIVTYETEGKFDVTLKITNEENEVLSKTFTEYISIGNNDTYWWNDAVFYEVFVRSYYDSNGDGRGDFKGLTKRLDYLNDGNDATHQDLGIKGIWLMPIMQSPTYHGYDVLDYRTIEQDYGTNDDFKEFIAAAHQRGIHVIIDYVMNHTSSENPWFLDSKQSQNNKRDWYIWRPTNPGWTGSWGQQVWHPYSGDYYYGVFWGGMPDLNYYNQEVRDEMFDIAKFWLEEMDVDGFRMDAAGIIYETDDLQDNTEQTFQHWRDFRSFSKSIKPDAFSVGEVWSSTDVVKQYVDNTGMDYCFEFNLASAILDATQNGNAAGLSNQMEKVMSSYPYLQFGTFITNHDIDRVMSILGEDNDKARLAAQLLLTLPGIPYIYYGEEIGMTGTKPDEDIRKPLQWDATSNAGFTTGNPWRNPNSDYRTKNIQDQKLDPTSLWTNYKNLISIRNNQLALRRGTYKNIQTNNNAAFAYLRQHEEENIIVVGNASQSIINSININLNLAKLPSGNYTLLDLLTGEQQAITIDQSGNIENQEIINLNPLDVKIFKLVEAQSINATVELKVDMNRSINENWFNPTSNTVNLVSDINDFGNTVITLSDNDNDGIYNISLPESLIGSSLKYKYRIDNLDDEKEEFPDSDYLRSYLVMEGENEVFNVYQSEFTITNLENSIIDNQILLYPNPVKDVVYIKLNEPVFNNISFEIIDIKGKLYKEGFLRNDETGTYIPISDLSNGLYLIQIKTDKSQITRKLVISN